MPQKFDANEHAHRRFNPLLKEWVLCSPHRTKRPWQGQTEPPQVDERPQYDPKCYLCPGNVRANGERNEKYSTSFIFENDFAAVKPDAADFLNLDPPFQSSEAGEGESSTDDPLFQVAPARGKCYVLCFNPRHDTTIAEMSAEEVEAVVSIWAKLYKEVSKDQPDIKYIQIFENKGSMMGCSNPHPHGQAWCLSYIPSEPQRILSSLQEYSQTSPSASSNEADFPVYTSGKPCLLLTYATRELRANSPRLVIPSAHFVSLIPFWATWPYEILILPHKRHIPSVAHLEDEERKDLADVLRRTTGRLDNLFKCSFPYSLGVMQAPVQHDNKNAEIAQLHIGLKPPLLRSASVRKFLVGFELFAEAQRDITPEQAAAKLRELPDVHYKQTE